MSELDRILNGEDEASTVDKEIPEPEVAEAPEPEPEPAHDWDEQAKKIAHSARMAERRRMTQAFEKERKEILDSVDAQIKKALEERLQPAAPDYETDPAGYLKYMQDKQKAELEKLQSQNAAKQAENAQVEQMRHAVAQTQHALRDFEQEFVSQQPDYYDALNYVREDVRKQWQLYPDDFFDNQLRSPNVNVILRAVKVDPDTLFSRQQKQDALLMAQEMMASTQLLQSGVSPAQYIYESAKRMGYAKKAPEESPEAKKQRLEKGQKHANTLSGGAPSVQTPTLQEVDNILNEVHNLR